MGLDYSQGLSRIAVRNGLPQAFALRCIHVYITQKFRLSPPPPSPISNTFLHLFFKQTMGEGGGREGREGEGREGGKGGGRERRRKGGEGGREGGGRRGGGRGQ